MRLLLDYITIFFKLLLPSHIKFSGVLTGIYILSKRWSLLLVIHLLLSLLSSSIWCLHLGLLESFLLLLKLHFLLVLRGLILLWLRIWLLLTLNGYLLLVHHLNFRLLLLTHGLLLIGSLNLLNLRLALVVKLMDYELLLKLLLLSYSLLQLVLRLLSECLVSLKLT